MDIDLETATVAELTGLLASGDLTSVRLTQGYLERIETLARLNAIRALNPEALAEAAAADEARGTGPNPPLLGIPVLIKDNIDVAGMPTTAGSVALADSYPGQDAPLVAGLRQAGAVILGKVNLTEFANFLSDHMPGGYSSLGGQVLNPYDTSQTPSGSSSGSAVAAAAGLAAITIGTETSGSILSPAACTSIVGIKPTIGLVSRTGIVPIAASQDTAGPMTRTVADAAATLTAITGKDAADPATEVNPLVGHDFTADLSATPLDGARIGVVAGQAPEPDTDERALWDAVLATLRARGAILVEVTLTNEPDDPHESTVLSYEFKRDLNAYFARLPADAPIRSLAEVISYNETHARVALKYGQVQALVSEAIDLHPDSADTTAYRASRARDLAESRDRIDAVLAEHRLTALLFAEIGGAAIGAKAGYPSINLPAGYLASNRWPYSISFLGPAFSEPTLIGYAYDYEQTALLRRPPSELNPTFFR